MIPVPIAEDNIAWSIPTAVQQKTIALRFFIVENIKTARRYLRKLDPEFPIDDSQFFILNKRTRPEDLRTFISPALDGHAIGVMSEAGCPGVADPGSIIAQQAHQNNIKVVPLVGPSSILLALMASGFDGQNFTFHGYVPFDQAALKKFLSQQRHNAQSGTQIFMDTPYRNQKLLETCLQYLSDTDSLCIAVDITGPQEYIQTHTVKAWKSKGFHFQEKLPALFLLGR